MKILLLLMKELNKIMPKSKTYNIEDKIKSDLNKNQK